MTGRLLRSTARPAERLLRAAPATIVYLLLLSSTTLLVHSLSSSAADRVLDSESTNLDHLARDPLHVLVGSAFLMPGGLRALLTLPLWGALVALAEWDLGTRLVALVFSVGHVGATLLVAAGLRVGVQADVIGRSVMNVQDVGPSYGFFAIAGAMTALLGPGLRRISVSLLVLCVTVPLVTSHRFSDVGHLLALGIGFACVPIVARRSTVQLRRLTWASAGRHLVGYLGYRA